MKTTLLILSLLMLTYRVVNRPKPRGSPDSDTTALRTFGDFSQAVANQGEMGSFIGRIISENQREIAMAGLALDKSLNTSLVAAAERMMKDHGTILLKLQSCIQTGNDRKVNGLTDSLCFRLNAPDTISAHEAPPYKQLSGERFDRAWVQDRINCQERIMNSLRVAIVITTSKELQSVIINAMSTVREHLDQLWKLQKEIGELNFQRRQGTATADTFSQYL